MREGKTLDLLLSVVLLIVQCPIVPCWTSSDAVTTTVRTRSTKQWFARLHYQQQPQRTFVTSSMMVQHSSPIDKSHADEPTLDRLFDSDNLEQYSKQPTNPLIPDHETGNVHIPTTGISVSDVMEDAQRDRFVTEVVPVQDLMGVAQLVTRATQTGSLEPLRYLVALSKPISPNIITEYALVDVPPYSAQLVAQLKAFMGVQGRLRHVLLTCRDALHYDEAQAVLATRRTDLQQWQQAFDLDTITAYRLDIPRDCRSLVTHVLDGYGPFALFESTDNCTFIETGRPLVVREWSYDIVQDILQGVRAPPDDDEKDDKSKNDDNLSNNAISKEDEDRYTPEAIRQREEGKRILVVYTPGRTFGSLSYIFPEQNLCCSGFTLPVEDDRRENESGTVIGRNAPGPMLDFRGYVTTNQAGIQRQTESAKKLIQQYADRFTVILPSRGEILFLDEFTTQKRQSYLLEAIDMYRRVGEIYEQLGITNDNENDIF